VPEHANALAAEGARNKRGKLIEKSFVYKLLNNRVYIGDAVHKGTAYPGEHEAIVTRELWDRVHAILKSSPRQRAAQTRSQTPSLLKGLIFGLGGRAMSPAHTRKGGGRRYRYYVNQAIIKGGPNTSPINRVPADEVVDPTGINIRLRVEGLGNLVDELNALTDDQRAA